MSGGMRPLELLDFGQLTFEKPDDRVFTTMDIAKSACAEGGTSCAYMNGANEALVEAFLNKKISFLQIQDNLEKMMDRYVPVKDIDFETLLDEDRRARKEVEKLI